MEKLLEFLKTATWQKILATAVLAFILGLVSFYFCSCGIARSAVSGDRVVDKNVRDSTHYEVTLEK